MEDGEWQDTGVSEDIELDSSQMNGESSFAE